MSSMSNAVSGFDRIVKLLVACDCCCDILPDTDNEKQRTLMELSTIYHSTIEPLESLYHFNILGIGSFTGTVYYSSAICNKLFIT